MSAYPVHPSIAGIRAVSERHELRSADGRLDKLLYTIQRQSLIALSAEARSLGGSDAGWHYGSIGTAAALVRSVTDGIPSEAARKAYDRVRRSYAFNETPDATIQRRRRRVFSDNGCEADGARWLAGDPEHWSSMRRVGRVSSITIGMQIAMSCGNGDEQFAENVATAVCLAESLVSAGYAVRIMGLSTMKNLLHTTKGNDVESGFMVPLTDYGCPIDQSSLMAYGSPGIFRWYGIHMYNALFAGDGNVNSTWGQAWETTPEMLTLSGIDILVAKQWDKPDGGQKDYLSRLKDKATALLSAGGAV